MHIRILGAMLMALWLTPYQICRAQDVVTIQALPDPSGGGVFVPSDVSVTAGRPLTIVAENGSFTAIQSDANYQPVIPVVYCLPQPECGPRQQPWTDTLTFAEPGDYYFFDLNYQSTMHLHVAVKSDAIFRSGFQAQGPLEIIADDTISVNEDAPQWSFEVHINTAGDPAELTLNAELVDDLSSLLLHNLVVSETADPYVREISAVGYPDISSAPPISSPATIRLVASDSDGGWASKDVTVDILPVNDPPSITFLRPVPLLHDADTSGAFTIDNFVTASPGPFGEENQTIHYDVEKADPNGVLATVAIDSTGTLVYELTGANGSANINIKAVDDGGIDRGGVDTSDSLTFSIQVGTPSMQFWTPAFAEDGLIPTIYTCDSVVPNGISPGLNWTNPPVGTGSFTVIAQDDFFVPHWTVHNLPVATSFLQPGIDVGAIPGVVWAPYLAPCPPAGGGPHMFSFNLYAMDSTFLFPPPPPPQQPYISTSEFEALYGAQILAKRTVNGYYQR